jgi:hypothetical protein
LTPPAPRTSDLPNNSSKRRHQADPPEALSPTSPRGWAWLVALPELIALPECLPTAWM